MHNIEATSITNTPVTREALHIFRYEFTIGSAKKNAKKVSRILRWKANHRPPES